MLASPTSSGSLGSKPNHDRPPSKSSAPRVPNPTTALRRVGDGSSAIASFAAALNDPSFADIKIRVRGVTYHLHRCILAARSPIFRTMLTGDFKEATEKEITIDEHPPEHFYAMLEWAYTGQASMTASSVLGVLRVADYYHFDDLVRECRELAVRFVDAENILALLRSAIGFEEEAVIHACLAFWAAQPTAVMSRPDWVRATPDTICRLLAHGELRCTEDAVLSTAVQWLRSRVSGPFSRLDSSESEEHEDGERPSGDEAESGRSLVGRVLGNIRLGQLSTASLFDLVKPLVEHYDVLRDKYMSTLEFKLDPDRFDVYAPENLHLLPRKGQVDR